ncbi:hypothetical protein ES703_118815 [subsurface metagenome]
MELKRALGTCCLEPGCDKTSCLGCEYISVCRDDPQKIDYCPLPRTCPSCGANCTKCDLWKAPIINWDFSKMTEGQALYSLGMRATEKDGKKGLNMPIPGKPGETLFIPASDEKPDAIIASDRKRDRVKGAKKTRCADCRCKVWISPSTQEMLRRYPGTPVICLPCLVKQAEAEGKQKKEG